MYAREELARRDDQPHEDHVVRLEEVSWADYERFLAIRGERSSPRFTYLEGLLEIMSPSKDHESIKSIIGRLVEVYCLHVDKVFSPFGSWTIKEEREERGAEPDECYVFGREQADRPHLAIEVEWTAGRIDKLEVYRKLGVPEVWYWRRGSIQVYVLRGDRYAQAPRSEALPELDIDLLLSFLDRPTAFDAIRDYRAALTSAPR